MYFLSEIFGESVDRLQAPPSFAQPLRLLSSSPSCHARMRTSNQSEQIVTAIAVKTLFIWHELLPLLNLSSLRHSQRRRRHSAAETSEMSRLAKCAARTFMAWRCKSETQEQEVIRTGGRKKCRDSDSLLDKTKGIKAGRKIEEKRQNMPMCMHARAPPLYRIEIFKGVPYDSRQRLREKRKLCLPLSLFSKRTLKGRRPALQRLLS